MSAARYSFGGGVQGEGVTETQGLQYSSTPILQSPCSEQVSHLCALGLEILRIVRIGLRFDRKLFDDIQTVSFESDHFFWIVGQETDVANAEIDQYLCTGTIFTEVHRKP